jgi:nucleotide-binding universal stress UspA family protein
MPFKTVLVHITHDEAHAARLRLAIEIAKRFEGHLTSLFTPSPVHMPAAISGRGASHAFLAQSVEIAREKGQKLEAECAGIVAEAGVKSWEWRVSEGDHLKALTHYGNLADLAIVAQSEPHTLEDMVAVEAPDHVTLYAACPVLVVPHHWHPHPVGKKILVAWKSKREATRAVREALPFLREAEKIVVLAPATEEGGLRPGHEIGAYLKRHGLDADFRVSRDDRAAGPTILDLATRESCDMIVMGAFGHSRWLEMVLGGATREVLRRMTVPVFMAH